MTNSRSIGPKLLNVVECSLLCVVSSIMPPQDMRKKSVWKKSTSRTAGFSDAGILGGQLLTRWSHSPYGMMLVRGISRASERIDIISGQGCLMGFSM